MHISALVLPLAAASLVTFSAPAPAADFYAGKTLNILVNFPTGGSTDLESRLMSRHLSKHVPGKPSIDRKSTRLNSSH